MKLKIKLKLKTLSIILCFSMLFQLLGTSFVITNAATIAPAKVSYTINGESKIGNTIDIAVNISNITNFYGGSVDFAYDTSLLEVQSITKGDIFGTNKVSEPVKSVSNGLASIGLTLTGSNAGVSTNGTLAIIKAKVLKEGTINIKTTPLNVALSPIEFSSRVKLSDNNGTFITYTAEDKVINLVSNIPTVPPVLTAGIYQNNDSKLNYTSKWLNTSALQAYTDIKNEALSFTFDGSGFILNSIVANNRGIANIYIDDILVKTVDTYSATVFYNKKVCEIVNLTPGIHNAKIVVTPNKNNASTGTCISVDSIEILKALPVTTTLLPGLYQNNDPKLNYTSKWINTSPLQAYTDIKNEALSFTFDGSGFILNSIVAN
ncbi:cohesin domain-containing protein, partial [Clostridium gasigenes]|uniref:cohesin domain-containing protein n=1 Tax=Clostridium gasigenes TaxID=94869 RepID=UPI001C0ACC51